MPQALPIRISFRINGTYLMSGIHMDQVPRVGDYVDFQSLLEEFDWLSERPNLAIGTVTAVTWALVKTMTPTGKHQWYVTVDTHHE